MVTRIGWFVAYGLAYGVVSTVGFAAAVLALGSDVVAPVVLGFLIGGCVTAGRAGFHSGDPTRTCSARRLARGGASGSWGLTSVAGLVWLAGPSGALVWLAARLVSMPGVRAQLRRWRGQPAAATVVPTAAGLSSDDLCREWRRSAAQLSTATTPSSAEQVVRYRSELLDELERLDPEGFARWLAHDQVIDPAAFIGVRHHH